MTTTQTTLRVLDIVPGTSVDGPGLRTSVYLAGCLHHCPGCHNPESWDLAGGSQMSIQRIIDVIEDNGFNVTITGGDPLYNHVEVAALCRELKSRGYNIWLYTGFTFDDVVAHAGMREVLAHIDVMVDGRFIESERDLSLRFRGSRNQRLIDVTGSLVKGSIILFEQA